MNHWIGIASAEHVRIGLEGGFAMFSHGRRSAAEQVRPGDWVAYYSPREGVKEGRRSAPSLRSARHWRARRRSAQMTGWFRRMRWLAGRPAGIYPLLDRFSFIADRQHWGMYFRKSLFRVPAQNFDLIAEAMGVKLS